MKQKIEEALNEQLNAEFYSGYLYLSMSAWFQARNLGGFSTWMRVQAQEELAHAMKFHDFILERGGRVNLKPIEGPKTEWESPLSAFEDAYAHEQKVTGLINDLVDLAQEERDHASQIFLHWFVTEQVEEEDNASEVVEKIKLVGDAAGGMFMLDREMGQRTFSPPGATSES